MPTRLDSVNDGNYALQREKTRKDNGLSTTIAGSLA
jgi:hypothetical protein